MSVPCGTDIFLYINNLVYFKFVEQVLGVP